MTTELKTPSSLWSIENKADPFNGRYLCERHELTLGELTDDQLANEVFLYGNEEPTMQQILNNEAKFPIMYLGAAKDRIRWLSRQNEMNRTKSKDYEDALRELVVEVCNATALDTNEVEKLPSLKRAMEVLINKGTPKIIADPTEKN